MRGGCTGGTGAAALAELLVRPGEVQGSNWHGGVWRLHRPLQGILLGEEGFGHSGEASKSRLRASATRNGRAGHRNEEQITALCSQPPFQLL